MEFKIKMNIESVQPQQYVGVLFSGGMDSTCLLSRIVYGTIETQQKIYAFNIDNKNNYTEHCKAILKHPFYSRVQYVDCVPNGEDYSGIIRQGIGHILRNEEIGFLYIGINKNPAFDHPAKPLRRTAEELKAYPKLRYPFLNYTKDIILGDMWLLEKELDLNVLALTKSCTESMAQPCGTCFQCTERAWAFSQIGVSDPLLQGVL